MARPGKVWSGRLAGRRVAVAVTRQRCATAWGSRWLGERLRMWESPVTLLSSGRRGEEFGRRKGECEGRRRQAGESRGGDTGHGTAASEARRDRQLLHTLQILSHRYPVFRPGLAIFFAPVPDLLLVPDAHAPSSMVLTAAFSELLGYISIACWVGAQFP